MERRVGKATGTRLAWSVDGGWLHWDEADGFMAEAEIANRVHASGSEEVDGEEGGGARDGPRCRCRH